VDDRDAGVTLTFLTSEKAIDCLRWSAAFAAVVLTYGAAGWMVLRPASWQLDVNAPVVEINLRDMPPFSVIPPTDRPSELTTPANPPSASAQTELPRSADTVARTAIGAASRANAGDAAKDTAEARDAGAEKTAALDKAENLAITQPEPAAGAAPEAPPKIEETATDSGGGSKPIASPPRVAMSDNGTAASIVRAPIDTSITVNQGSSLLRSAKGGAQTRGLPLPQLKLTPPLVTLKEPFSKKLNPVAAWALPATGPATRSPDAAQKPAIGADGGLARNAIGIIIERHAVGPPAGAPLGIHPLPSAMSTARHASGERSAATTAVGAPLAAGNARPGGTGLSNGPANEWQAGHPDRAFPPSHAASIGGPAVKGTGASRAASGAGAVGGLARVVTGALNGSSFRPKYP
jgi:hypothetical protein